MDPSPLALLGAVGLTVIVTMGAIFKPLRERFKTRLLRCAQCLGFWVGAVPWAAVAWPPPWAFVPSVEWLAGALVVGGAVSLLAYLSARLIVFLDTYTQAHGGEI